MIYWYSGTGNSRLVAERLAEHLGENAASVIEAMGKQIQGEQGDLGNRLQSLQPVGIVFPVYSWGVPPIVLRFLEHLGSASASEGEAKPVWMVCTCGDETGMTPRMFRRAAEKSGLTVAGMWSVQMPNNYVLLPGFDVDPESLAEDKLKACEARIAEIADGIRRLSPDIQETVVDCHLGPWPRLKTNVVYPLFKKWGVFPDKWRATEQCTGCGACAKACPVANIKMVESGGERHAVPRWGRDCLSCTACYHVCPQNAVQYGRATCGKGQYSLRKLLKI